MPELPDLQVVQEFLARELAGAIVAGAEVRRPLVVRDLLGSPPGAALAGKGILQVRRWGKFLCIELQQGIWLVINPKLAGRLALCAGDDPVSGHTVLRLCLRDGRDLRYLDAKDMGQVYVARSPQQVPGYVAQGPDALDPMLTVEVFVQRLRPFRGEIKGVLRRQELVAGIGNAYADEILFAACISPFRKVTSLTAGERERLYQAMRETLAEAVCVLRERVGHRIDIEVRDFLKVHGRGGEPCPVCGQAISQLTARQQITSFCRRCQPGTLVRN